MLTKDRNVLGPRPGESRPSRYERGRKRLCPAPARERRRSPPGALRVPRRLMRGLSLHLLFLFALLAQNSFTAELDLVALERQHFHQDLVAFLQLIAHIPNAVLRHLADVQQAVGAWENLHKGPEIDEPHHFAE